VSGRTELQQEIIGYLQQNPEADPSKVAEDIDCSASWVRETVQNNLESVVGETDLYEYNIEVCHSDPYSVYVSDNVYDELTTTEENLVKIEFKTKPGNDRSTRITGCKNKNELDISSEFRSQVYGLERVSEPVPDKYLGVLNRFIREDSSELEIYSESDFKEFLNRFQEVIERTYDEADIIIGADLLTSALDVDMSDDPTTVSLPNNILIEETFVDLIAEGDDLLLDIRSLSDDDKIFRPESVYFTCTSRDEYENVKSEITDMKYFDLNHRYIFGTYEPVSGPQLLNNKERIVKVDEENLKIVEEKFLFNFVRRGSIDQDFINEITEDMSIEQDGKVYPVHRMVERVSEERSRITLFLGSLSITLHSTKDSISFLHPSEPEVIVDFIESFIENVSRARDIEIQRVDSKPLDSPGHTLDSADCFVFDTNAIYNNVHSEEPESILRTFFNNRQFIDSEIRIPWTVLYEINKHKDKGGPGSRVQENGVENLKMLDILDQYDFTSLHVEKIPNSIGGQIGESDIADMHILQCSQEQDAVLISGDNRLREIASLSGVAVTDIKEIVETPAVPELRDAVQDEVLSKIGTEIRSKNDVISAVNDEIENQLQQSKPGRGQSSQDVSPEDYIQSWVQEDHLVPVVDTLEAESGDQRQLMYDRGNAVDVVLTPTAAGELASDIVEYQGSSYLSIASLEYLKSLPGASGPGLPSITLYVPVSNVIAPQSANIGGLSTTARQFYKLRTVENVKYESADLSEAMPRNEYIHDAVLLSRQEDYPLLCAREDKFMNRIAGLINVDVFEYDR